MSLLMRRSSPVPQATTVVHPVESPPAKNIPPLWQESYGRTAADNSAISEEEDEIAKAITFGHAEYAHDDSAGPCTSHRQGRASTPAGGRRRGCHRLLSGLRTVLLADTINCSDRGADEQCRLTAAARHHRCQPDQSEGPACAPRRRKSDRIPPQRPIAGSVVGLPATTVADAGCLGDQEP